MSPTSTQTASQRPASGRGDREAAARPSEREQFDRVLRRKGGQGAEGSANGEDADANALPAWPAAPLTAGFGALGTDTAGPPAMQALQAAQALTQATRQAEGLDAACGSARTEQASATAEVLQRSLAGADRAEAATQSSWQATTRAEALVGAQPARQFDVTLPAQGGLRLQMQATQPAQGLATDAARAPQSAQAADPGRAPWTLTLAAHGRDFQAAARHLPQLQARLRERALGDAEVRLRDTGHADRNDDACGSGESA